MNKIKCIIVTTEGIAVQVIAHAVGWYYLANKLMEWSIDIPSVTAGMLATSSFSTLVAITYLLVRTKSVPNLTVNYNSFLFSIIGVIIIWFVLVANLMLSGKYIPFARDVLSIEDNLYLYATIFMLAILGPTLEEILYRGYFYEIISKLFGVVLSVLITSSLFVLFHGIWGVFDANLIFVFIYSVIFNCIYINGGLISSIAVHAFVNSYLLYINT